MKDRFQVQCDKDLAVLQSLVKRKEPAILEWKTRRPFNGCWWQWSYAFVNGGFLSPIVITEQDMEFADSVIDDIICLLKQTTKFDTLSVYDVDDDLWKDIPDGFIPAFWEFLDELDIPFTWNCDGCGLTTNKPEGMSSYTGNGGIGIEVTGWYCDECHASIQCSSCGVLNDPQQPWWGYDDELIRLYNKGYCPQCKEER